MELGPIEHRTKILKELVDHIIVSGINPATFSHGSNLRISEADVQLISPYCESLGYIAKTTEGFYGENYQPAVGIELVPCDKEDGESIEISMEEYRFYRFYRDNPVLRGLFKVFGKC